MAHVWVWYCELADARTSNGFGANPIGYQDIDAWARLMRVRPEPWEVRLLRMIDSAVLAKSAERSEMDKNAIPVNDVNRVSSLFAGLKARQEAAMEG